MGFDFWRATPKDAPLVWTVRNSSLEFLHDKRAFSLEETRDFLGSDHGFWIIARRGTPIGYFRTKKLNSAEWQIGADLSSLYRGRGWARPLYRQFVEEVLLPLGCGSLTLKVLQGNERAIHLYKSMGFVQCSESDFDLTMTCKASTLLERVSL